MKNRIIYPTFAVALALAGATAMAGINGFERKNYEKAPVLTRHQQTPLNLRQPRLNYNAASPEMLSAKSEDTPKVIFSNEPVNDAASYTTDCYTGNKWQGANIMDRNDGNVWINCVTDNQARASVGLQDDWIWFPADITIPNATLSFSGKVSNQYNNAHQNFEILLCSEESKDAVIGTFLVYDNFDVPEGSRSPYRNYFQAIDGECKGPSAPGRYYLAIHVKGSDPSNKYSFSMLNFGALTLTEVSTEPELGPNGEIFEIHPTEAEFNASTVIDANNDGHTITYYAHQSEIDGKYFDWPIFYENSYTENDADEWFITTGVDIRRPDLKHTVSVEAMALATGSTEAFEIAIGTQPDIESMTKIIMNQPGVGNNKGEFTKFTSNFAVPQEGIYYFGIHVKSRRSTGWRIAMRNFTVCQTEDNALLPSSCSDITLTADPKGAHKLTAEFTMPVSYINEDLITEGEEISVDVITAAETKTVTGLPGEKMSVEAAAVEGTNNVEFRPYNANGVGNTTFARVVCGLDIPANPAISAAYSDDNMSATLSWTLPAEGANGGIVDPEGVTYALYTLTSNESSYYWALWIDNITQTSVTVNAPNTIQNVFDVMVSAKNEKGESEGGQISSASLVLGSPYTMPMADMFDNGGTLSGLNFAYPDKNYEGMWALDNPGLLGDDAADENGKSLICISQSEYTVKGQLLLPKFSTKDSEHARVNLMMFCYSGMATSDVYAVNNSGEQVLLGTINYEGCTSSGWKNFIFDLPAEWNGKPWAYVICDVTMANPYQYFVLDKYEAYDCPPTDYRVRNLKFNLSEGMSLGSEIGFEATVENIGYTTSAFPALKGSVMDGKNVISEIDIELPETNTLGDSESAQVSGTFSIRKADYVGRELTLLLEVTDADGNIANNTASRSFTIDMPDAPVVTDLTATEADSFGKHVFLNWSDPYEGGLTETFESIAHGWYGTFIGEWKNIDYDGRVPFALGSYDVPDGSRPKAFQVLDIKELGIEGLDLPSGSRLLCAMCAETGVTDDWLISPELVPGSVLSFWAAALSNNFAERIEILYSTTDNDADSFKELNTFTVTEAGWKPYSFRLPDDARYIAIHYASQDQFGIFIDDLLYSPLHPRIEIVGFNVYRDDELVITNASKPGVRDEPEFDINHRYNVAVIGSCNGIEQEYPLSNTATCQLSGLETVGSAVAVTGHEGYISVVGLEGSRAEVFNAGGVRTALIEKCSSTENVAAAPGVYIVKAGTKAYKVFVR